MSKGDSIEFSCTCGQVQGTIQQVAPNRGNHVMCYCKSCQTAANVLGYESNLDAYGGTEVFQTVPGRVEFLAGTDSLACLKLSPKGLLRWHCAHCQAPLFTMPEASWFPIAGLNMARIAQVDRKKFGPLVGVHQAKAARNAPSDLKTFGIKRSLVRVFWWAFKARVKGDSQSPFFTEKGQVSVTPRVLTLDERKAASPE